MKFHYLVSVHVNSEHHMLTVRTKSPDHARLKAVKRLRKEGIYISHHEAAHALVRNLNK